MIQMLGLTRKKSQDQLVDDIEDKILDRLEESQVEIDKKVIDQDKLVRKIMLETNPTELDKQIMLFDLRKDFVRRLEQGERAKITRMKEKRAKGKGDVEDEPESPNELPIVDVKAQTEAIENYLGKLSPAKRTIVESATKAVTGHSIKEIIADPTILGGTVEKIKNAIPQLGDKQKKTGFINSIGKEIDPYDETGYSMIP